ncbi:hypothetical protein GCM10009836_72670 [Pseudonocardia ailaonensis]|uniref:DNA alkylation repair protein n=1 Tax=Pseudonocardia ailaonensis TaxID=367279 RepID=A0ABN2NQ41_9PSEU
MLSRSGWGRRQDLVEDLWATKVHDWLLANVVRKSAHAEVLRQTWFADPDPVVANAGWALTVDRVAKRPEGLDLPSLLDGIEASMKAAPDRLQWAMNHCLTQLGIDHAEHRARALAIGERLRVLEDYPTPPNCTSPYAPCGSPSWSGAGRADTSPRQPGQGLPAVEIVGR